MRMSALRKLIRSALMAATVTTMMTFAAGCSRLVFTVTNIPARFSPALLKGDISYGTQPRQTLDIYLPPGGAARRPVVIFWYGGAWSEGRKSDYRFVGTVLAEKGYVVVLPDYRLYPQVKFPCVRGGRRASGRMGAVACTGIWRRSGAHRFHGALGRCATRGPAGI